MVFLGGIGISTDPGSIPVAACAGILVGSLVGVLIFRLGSSVKLRFFFVGSSIFLFFLSNGLLVKATLQFQKYRWLQAVGVSGDGDAVTTYDIFSTVFKLNCCDPGYFNYGFSLLNAVVGWDSWGTYASVLVYCGFWIGLAVGLCMVKLRRRKARR